MPGFATKFPYWAILGGLLRGSLVGPATIANREQLSFFGMGIVCSCDHFHLTFLFKSLEDT
jgi:hypothetical protein